MEIPLIIPLCEPESEKSEKEAKVWQLGSNPIDEKEAVLALIAVSILNNYLKVFFDTSRVKLDYIDDKYPREFTTTFLNLVSKCTIP